MTRLPSTQNRPVRGIGILLGSLALGLGTTLIGVPPAQAADAARSFSCTGSLGEAFTSRTVTGLLDRNGVPNNVTVQTAAGAVDSSRVRRATAVGPSPLHAGFTAWDVTGPNPAGDVYTLSIPPRLPGAGGFFDADLQIDFAGGANGNWQIPMTDCTVTGGPAALSTPPGPRSFSCTGGLGEAFTVRTVTGSLTRRNQPYAVSVTEPGGTVDSQRKQAALLVGPSALHTGYTEWDVTGPNVNGDTFHLSTPPVLPPVGGYFDADLEIAFAGGANGSWQIPMTDCTVR